MQPSAGKAKTFSLRPACLQDFANLRQPFLPLRNFFAQLAVRLVDVSMQQGYAVPSSKLAEQMAIAAGDLCNARIPSRRSGVST